MSMSFLRHSLVWPTALGWIKIKESTTDNLKNIIDQWSSSNWPVVVRRQEFSNLDNEISVGIAVSENKIRIPFTLKISDIQENRTHLELDEVIKASPNAWKNHLIEMSKYAKLYNIKIGVYGSLAWQAITGEPYLNENSDIDLYFSPQNHFELKKILFLIKSYQHLLPLDGEIQFPTNKAVSFKEFNQASDWVLIKQQNDVSLVTKNSLYQSLDSHEFSVGRFAIRSLYHEMALFPKPGLVSKNDNGSHADMNAVTLMKSILSLRHYFKKIAKAGLNEASFETLKSLAIEAENKMLLATNGVNTHRGAIFALGLISAVLGFLKGAKVPVTEKTIRLALKDKWGVALQNHAMQKGKNSHGAKAQSVYGINGAKMEAANGFFSIFEIALPAFYKTLQEGRDLKCAGLDALFSLIAHLDDTNIYYRGGLIAATFVKNSAKSFLEQGGTAHPDYFSHAEKIHNEFVRLNLSPGGSADLLAATFLVYEAINE